MGILDLFRKKDSVNVELARTLAYAKAQQHGGTDELDKQLSLGVKDAVIKDKGAEAIYDSETYDYILEQNEQGGLVTKPVGPNYAGQAMRLFLSPKLGLGNIDKKEARHEMLLAEREAINMEMNSNEFDFHLGIGSRFVAQLVHIRQGILGSIEGKTMRNLLITPQVTRVEAGEISKKKGQNFI